VRENAGFIFSPSFNSVYACGLKEVSVQIVQAIGASHPGSRAVNEDAILRLNQLPMPIFAVADGMGGPGVGDVAAELALEVLKRNSAKLGELSEKILSARSTANRLALSNALDALFNEASRAIREKSNELQVAGMACTLLLVTVVDQFAYVAHVGDSRAYLFREGELMRLTEDHSVAEFRYRRGRMTLEEYEQSPERQVLYQALGTGVEVDVDIGEVRLANNDVMLLCTDGLIRALGEDEIAANIDPANLSDSGRHLIHLANAKGAPDNLSVVLYGLRAQPNDEEPLQQLTEVMDRIFLFEVLTPQERLVIAPYLEEVVADAGEEVVTEGEEADYFYVIVEGQVRITRHGTHLTDFGPGQHFGELALTRPAVRSATVTALTRTLMLAFSRDRFNEIVRSKPGIGASLTLALLDTVGNRLRDVSDRLNSVERAVRGTLSKNT
jgi:serine/threonine protein phosphatase PrpC